MLFDSLDNDEQEYAEQILLDFTGFVLYYQNCVPEDWSPSVIEHCLVKNFPRRKPVDFSSIPKATRDWFMAISKMTDAFCNERLDEDYAGLCRYVAGKLARKRDNKISRGKREIWAAGIIYAVGQMNFLFDKSFEPYQSADDICQYFGTSKSTTSQKAKLIRDLIGMDDYWDPEYSTSYMRNKNPFEKFCMTKNGFII